MSDFLQTLNPRQREAVEHDGGALVLAGAGTGKTRVLTGRIVRLLTTNRVAPHQILAVTFTNKAAQEMRKRVDMEAPGMTKRGLWLGTFHGIAHRLLQAHATTAGLDKNFEILDTQNQLDFLRRLYEEYKLRDRVHEAFVDEKVAQSAINKAKEKCLRAAEMPAKKKPESAAIARVYTLYEAACKRENKVDFAELLLASLELLRDNVELRVHYARRFRHILIDELQDTNKLKLDWLAQLDSGDNQFFGVGDDDQSIYAFLGARPRILKDFQNACRAHKIIRLEENYRSSKNILIAANKLISCNHERLGKVLRATISDDEKIELFINLNGAMEADNVARHIAEQLKSGVSANKIVVLYRISAQGRLFERALTEHSVPYRVYGGLRFYDRPEIRHALSYMRLAATNNKGALLQVINNPSSGISEEEKKEMMKNENIFAPLQKPSNDKVAAFGQLIKELRDVVASQAPLKLLARDAVEKSGLLNYYIDRKDYERVENLRELISAAAQFDARAEKEAMEKEAAKARMKKEGKKELETETEDEATPLQAFLAMAALESSADFDSHGKESEGKISSTISLMTVHAAKGLEFENVYIVGLEEGLYPYPKNLNLEEERRLMYVAITRARRRLFLSFARERMQKGRTELSQHSQFINELPEECLAKPSVFLLPTTANFSFNNNVSESEKPVAFLSRDNSLRRGNEAWHRKYGIGVVLDIEDNNKEAVAEINFRRFGIIALPLATLTKVS